MPMRAWISSIMSQIEPEHPELFAFEFRKIAESDLFYNLASTNNDQSAPNLVKMYMTIRSQMSLIMDLIGPELSELSALEFEKFAIIDFVNTLTSSNIDQLVPNMTTIFMPIKSQMRSILGQIESEHLELSAFEFENLPYLTVNTLASANIDQSVPNLATIYMPIKSLTNLIMGQIESEHPELFAIEFRKIAKSDFVYTLASTTIDQSTPNFVKMYVTI